ARRGPPQRHLARRGGPPAARPRERRSPAACGAPRAPQARRRPAALRGHRGGGPGRARRGRGQVMRRALLVAAATAVFAVVLALSFPTDELARWGLARAPLPDGRFITFERAHLRPWGLVLDGATLRRPDGGALYTADWVRLRPSWGRRPWRPAAGLPGAA